VHHSLLPIITSAIPKKTAKLVATANRNIIANTFNFVIIGYPYLLFYYNTKTNSQQVKNCAGYLIYLGFRLG
jgi:hypothetical protein